MNNLKQLDLPVCQPALSQ